MFSPLNLRLKLAFVVGSGVIASATGISTIVSNGSKINEVVSVATAPAINFLNQQAKGFKEGIGKVAVKNGEWAKTAYSTVFTGGGSMSVPAGVQKVVSGVSGYGTIFSAIFETMKTNLGLQSSSSSSGSSSNLSALQRGAALIRSFPERMVSLLTTCGGEASSSESSDVAGTCSGDQDGDVLVTFWNLVKQIFNGEGADAEATD